MAQSNEQESDELLRERLIEEYMGVAAGFYFEGSDSETERSKYAPEFAARIMQLILADRKQHELEARKARVEQSKSLCGCPMCFHHERAYELQALRTKAPSQVNKKGETNGT